ncbi:unnamed protein product [Diatraea saccharalis]|uniref:Odorant receptor n=1 Tax=Diatraea saccharalis TaxID=40085 RepID=A0A9N9WA16_9NEOP|nr:unnamed protein product [Diatraea saccharalis]
MSDETLYEAKREIAESLILNTFCMKRIGISFECPKSSLAKLRQKFVFVLSTWAICYHVFSEIAFIGLTLAKEPRVEDVVPLFHTFGYGALSIAKLFVLWYKKDVFKQLIYELAGYFALNILGVLFYSLTPMGIYFYRRWQGMDVQMGYVWVSWYPFDKHETYAHVAVYIFEMFAGQTSVFIMVSTDLLFSGMASHIGLLLRLLQRRLESFAIADQTEQEQFEEIKAIIKLHQRLIRYSNDLEGAFSLSNLVNVVISSVNICCVVFVIVVSVLYTYTLYELT